ncbi:hypothetical protein A2962_05330 [Candidatus Woesebacteria bacterium RIFCSPLOWO2_01_FULL_39_61]|uniref:Glycosyltransferase RgtA/B/C/D-like domain-containing protein n=1 Tax=Candidatus Woesebacteria bacterium RIFCSPHIGHO2_02_FULL_39_13 TaxID=1802505 RepID=A0A1F7Z2S8_9BACT|nr:MAG: hypothetical protein A2692_05675 [Candidatus Woesebacteria bacterium RIFCSPHIGHO2_01_FULL_39_95]OGM33892.1 MAG: hypothetical protein A3D01_05725 [Candidatus Woesebacteria bacterium RIFCSPHIGHO2_02_FULL_39_13]OGM37181.1 MAG: hypothetical protein A3E13_03055 [Candidatus Woesebacteria bacterium RIFCSPHIGHO2_12_FULL_40_20]OGM68303.1 MAG: hypothetical protein A2962_05330 [Candidatus Woesebacteria bacterium RIFCSPLOWO2_01_FULL_39_61]OGM74049.1 MAG: hypothetical protein A3H19_02370 [Candidatus
MKKYLLIYLAAAIIFLAHYAFSGQAIYGDGIDYWVYLPSIYFDHDIDFENQYKHIFSPANNNKYSSESAPDILKTRYTSIGKTDNPHPPGTAIFWFPAFLLADIASIILGLARNGYAHVYQILAGLWSILLIVFALRLNELLVFKFTKDGKISFLTTIALFFTTPLLYYGSYDVLNSHFASFFLSSLFWYLLLIRPIELKSLLLLGSVVGLATLVRLQDALLIVSASVYLYLKYKNPVLKILTLSLTGLLLILPLACLWMYLYGIPLPETYTAFGRGEWLKFGSLFHPTYGFFFRTPFLLVSLIGIKIFIPKERKVFWVFFTLFILQFLLITFQGGWDAPSYGGRMYISTLTFFAVLIAYTLNWIKQKWNFKIAVVVVIFFVILNIISITSFVLFEKEVNSGRKRGLEEQTQQKLEQLLKRQ